jgi:hypothetical protein
MFSCCELSAQKKDWLAELERGYRANSQEPLAAFLDAWHSDSRPVAADIMEKKLPFEKDVYDIYFAVFSPDNRYDNTKYIIIQDEINVEVVDSDLRAEFTAEPFDRHRNRMKNLLAISSVVVEDFRPDIGTALEGKKVLYRQDKYLGSLVGFITQDKDPFALLHGNRYQWEENGSKERRKRLQYLNGSLHILRRPWVRGWDFETHPAISRIYLSWNMQRAIVRYRVGSGFGEALLEKAGDRVWDLLSMRIYAIE